MIYSGTMHNELKLSEFTEIIQKYLANIPIFL